MVVMYTKLSKSKCQIKPNPILDEASLWAG